MNTLLKQYRALIENESDIIAIMSNTSAFIYENMKNLNWAGFYIMKDGELILGPFQGKVACYRINLDRGVCGYCARNKESIIVDDVHKFQDHIACDSASNSEFVVPVIKNEKLGVKSNLCSTGLSLMKKRLPSIKSKALFTVPSAPCSFASYNSIVTNSVFGTVFK